DATRRRPLRPRQSVVDHARRAGRRPPDEGGNAGVLSGPAVGTRARWSRPADPLVGPLLHRLEPRPPERPRAEPELPRPPPAPLRAHRRADERTRGEGYFPGRPRQRR